MLCPLSVIAFFLSTYRSGRVGIARQGLNRGRSVTDDWRKDLGTKKSRNKGSRQKLAVQIPWIILQYTKYPCPTFSPISKLLGKLMCFELGKTDLPRLLFDYPAVLISRTSYALSEYLLGASRPAARPPGTPRRAGMQAPKPYSEASMRAFRISFMFMV